MLVDLNPLCVLARVFCGTLAARDLTGSFLSAAPSLAPAAALWVAGKLASSLQAAFPCRSPPKHKVGVFIAFRWNPWGKSRNVSTEVYKEAINILQLTLMCASGTAFDVGRLGSERAELRGFKHNLCKTPVTILQISLNNAETAMHFLYHSHSFNNLKIQCGNLRKRLLSVL